MGAGLTLSLTKGAGVRQDSLAGLTPRARNPGIPAQTVHVYCVDLGALGRGRSGARRSILSGLQVVFTGRTGHRPGL